MIRNTVITGNSASWGCGVSLYGGATAILENVIIIDNHRPSSGPGYGVSCATGSDVALVNATVVGNDGGGLQLTDGATGVVVNSILWDNGPPQISFYAAYDPCSLAVSHSDLSGGWEGVVTNDNGLLDWLDGNIDQEPLFQVGGDYRLGPFSPCIDAGTPYFEWDGRVLVDLAPDDYCGEAPDMGAIEYCDEPAAVAGGPPARTAMLMARPNPFRRRATVTFSTDRRRPLRLGVYDVQGRLVSILADGMSRSGGQSVDWDGRNMAGRAVASGAYLLRLDLGDRVESRTILLVR